ncbi:MAG: YitT family protein [Bacilli bacterium]|nr:YitT family protein [Bacilli bacterium]
MKNKHRLAHDINRLTTFIIGTYIIALSYNTFLKPNSLVIGGTTGLSIIFEKLFGWDTNIFILVSGLILLVISYAFLGVKKSRHNVLGALIFPLMVYLSAPLAEVLIPQIKIDDFFVITLIAGLTYGLGFGIVYKAGYSTGGLDIIMQIFNKYLKMPEGKASFVASIVVVLCGLPLFGISHTVYSSIVLYIEQLVTNKIVIGISDSKLFYIYTRKIDKVRDALVKDGATGFTIIPTLGGYSHYKGEMLMCVVDTKDYYEFRELVLSIDKDAFFIIDDCYEVNGGTKRKHLPFL